MSTAGLSYEELQVRKKLLMEELQNTQNSINTNVTDAGAMDIHHPERSPNWKPYRFQAYPKIVYHPVKLDPDREAQRLGVRRRNEANPNFAPLDIPHPQPLTRKVNSKTEEEQAIAEGFVNAPPNMRLEEESESKQGAMMAVNVAPQKKRA